MPAVPILYPFSFSDFFFCVSLLLLPPENLNRASFILSYSDFTTESSFIEEAVRNFSIKNNFIEVGCGCLNYNLYTWTKNNEIDIK